MVKRSKKEGGRKQMTKQITRKIYHQTLAVSITLSRAQ